MPGIIDKLQVHPPRYGPEWGSGGIFGLKYHRGVLYYTVAFEAEAYFIREDSVKTYGFEKVGSPPTSGGDTYNAVDAVDDLIFFGGWVHAPAKYVLENGRRKINFENKYSHVHVYNISEDTIDLLWKDSVHEKEKWAGEVSEIIYDPVNDRLLLARGDGMENLGIYSLDYKTRKITRLTNKPVLKGTLIREHACFNVHIFGFTGTESIQCIDLVSGKIRVHSIPRGGERVVDGGSVEAPMTGAMASCYGRLFDFVRGGLFIGNPADEEEPMCFLRLFDFVASGYGPLRTKAVNIGGGILVAYNAFTHAVLRPSNEFEQMIKKGLNTIVGPSVLVYITPPSARIVGVFGARITSIEKVGGSIVLGVSNDANYMWYDATPNDTGTKSFVVLPDSMLAKTPPPVTYSVYGWMISNKHWGGIPLYGYKEPRLVINASKKNTLEIHEYDLSIPPAGSVVEKISIDEGKNIIDLKSCRGAIVSFRLAGEDTKLRGRIILE